MARMICMFLIIWCMVLQTLQNENNDLNYKTLHVYKSKEDLIGKPVVINANHDENSFLNVRRKRDSNASNDKIENNKNITTAVSESLKIL